MINYVVTPYAKTKCIANCSEVLINSIQEQTSLTEANADNFLPQLIYVLIKANPAYLKTNLAYITAFNTMGATETQYYKASLEIAVGFIDQLDDAGIEGLLKSPVEKEWLQATPKKSNKAPALSLAKHAPSSSSSSSSSVSPVSSPGSSFPPSKATFAAAPDFDEAAVTSPGCASTMTTAKKISSPEPVTTATTRLTHLPSSPLPPPSSLSRRITTASTVAATSSPNEKYFIMLRKSCKANLVFDYRRGGGKDIKTGPRKVARPSTAKELGLGEAPSYPPTVPPGVLQGSRPKSSTSLSDSTWEPGTLPLIKQYNKRKTFLEKTAAPCTSEPSSRRSSSAVKDLTKSTSVALSSSSSSSSTVSRTGSGSGISSGYADYDSDNYDDDDDEDEEDDISEDDDTDSVETGFGKDSKTFSEKSIASGTPAKQSKQKPSK